MKMTTPKIIDSEQKAACFDCGKLRKIYAYQNVLNVLKGNASQVPTCKKCHKANERLDKQIEQREQRQAALMAQAIAAHKARKAQA